MAGEFKIIGLCLGVRTEAGGEGTGVAFAMIKIQHDGTTNEWKCWSTSEAKKCDAGNWYEFEVSTPPRKEGAGVWHNVNKVIGPAEKPVANGGGPGAQASHPLKTDVQFAKERIGMNRHGAIKHVLTALGLAPNLTDPGPQTLSDFMDMVMGEAERLEAWYMRDPGQPASEAPKPKAERVVRNSVGASLDDPQEMTQLTSDTAPATNGHAVTTFANIGELLTLLRKDFNKGPTDLCKLVGVDEVKEIKDFAATYKIAVEAWGTPVEVP